MKSRLFMDIPPSYPEYRKTSVQYQPLCGLKKKLFYLFVTVIFCSHLAAGTLAQLVEQRTENPCVPCSIQGGATNKKARPDPGFFVDISKSQILNRKNFQIPNLKSISPNNFYSPVIVTHGSMNSINGKKYDLEECTFRFTKNIIDYIEKLPKSITNIEIGRQIMRSVGANYIEDNESLSKKDFVMRVKISKKEAKESKYCLKLSTPNSKYEHLRTELMCECEELKKIFGVIILNMTI